MMWQGEEKDQKHNHAVVWEMTPLNMAICTQPIRELLHKLRPLHISTCIFPPGLCLVFWGKWDDVEKMKYRLEAETWDHVTFRDRCGLVYINRNIPVNIMRCFDKGSSQKACSLTVSCSVLHKCLCFIHFPSRPFCVSFLVFPVDTDFCFTSVCVQKGRKEAKHTNFDSFCTPNLFMV